MLTLDPLPITMKHRIALAFLPLLYTAPSSAQCGAGEVQVTIHIITDNYGYETYWQLVPGGNACGEGTIFEGGNPTMDCGSAGAQLQVMQGYANNDTIIEGPWCLTEGALYSIHVLDDWGDGQATIEVYLNGENAGVFAGSGELNVYTFGAERDMAVTGSTTGIFGNVNTPLRVLGTLRTFGSEPVTSFDLSYSVDGGIPTTTTVTDLTLTPGSAYEFEHAIPWMPALAGNASLSVYVSSINGGSDQNPLNDEMVTQHVISPQIPDLADEYLAADPLITLVANSDQDIVVPRDLAFHPDAARNQLWVLNKETSATGGSTVTFYNAGEPDQTHEWRQDQNAWHFMNLPTGIAMGDNNCFATSPGIFDANQNGGDPFTGPSLWSADTSIYCRFYGGLGSHLDMLHVDPQSQGIAHECWNRYWLMSGFRGDITMNDFKEDHGPGNDYHGNAIIKRYADFSFAKDPNDHVVSHNVLDKSTGWLYVVDYGGQRVLRLNTRTGTVSGPGVYGPWEDYVEYSMVTGYDWEVIITDGLVEPAGIEVVGTHLYVSDHSNGDIIIYDISGPAVTEQGRIHTIDPGLMGITVGPDGRIWGVNATNHELLRIDPQAPSGVDSPIEDQLRCWPNPADDRLYVEMPGDLRGTGRYALVDAAGRTLTTGSVGGRIITLRTDALPDGTYALELSGQKGHRTTKVIIAH